MREWQLVVLFFIGVLGVIFELGFQPEIRPLALATDLVLIGLLPVDVILRNVRHNGNGLPGTRRDSPPGES